MNSITRFPEAVAVAPDLDRHASVLTELQQIHADYARVLAENGQLKADLHREQDRCIMMIEDRDRYRYRCIKVERLLMLQSTKMVDAALVLERAKDTLQELEEMDAGGTPTSEAIDQLEAQFKKGSAA